MFHFKFCAFAYAGPTPEHDGTVLSSEDDVQIQFDTRKPTNFELSANTEKRLADARRDLYEIQSQLAKAEEAVAELRKQVSTKNEEILYLEKARTREIQNRNWAELTRNKLIKNPNNFDQEASDIFCALRGLRSYQEETKQPTFVECVKTLLPQQYADSITLELQRLSRKCAISVVDRICTSSL
jgi:hypothetical protein